MEKFHFLLILLIAVQIVFIAQILSLDGYGDKRADIDLTGEERPELDRGVLGIILERNENQTPKFGLKPNYSEVFDVGHFVYDIVKIEINRRGFRDKVYSVEKPEDVYRIAVLGDSVTFGWGVNRSHTYVEVFGEKINRASKRKIQVMNFGVPGYDQDEEVELLKSEVLRYEPDLVLVGYTPDEDILPKNLSAEEEATVEEHVESLRSNISSREEARERMLKKNEIIYSEYNNETIEQSWSRVARRLERLENISERENIPIGIFSHTYHSEEQSPRLESAADKYGWDYIEIGISTREFSEKYRLSENDWHPSVKGHNVIAEEIYKYYREGLPN